eukprot:245561-Rhodomonas_salina.1
MEREHRAAHQQADALRRAKRELKRAQEVQDRAALARSIGVERARAVADHSLSARFKLGAQAHAAASGRGARVEERAAVERARSREPVTHGPPAPATRAASELTPPRPSLRSASGTPTRSRLGYDGPRRPHGPQAGSHGGAAAGTRMSASV